MTSNLNGFITICLSLTMLLISFAAVADSEIDPSWRKHHVSISFIDTEKRLFVASDREFFVPFDTPIYSAQRQAIAMTNLKRGDSIWLYVDRDNSKAIKWIAVKKNSG